MRIEGQSSTGRPRTTTFPMAVFYAEDPDDAFDSHDPLPYVGQTEICLPSRTPNTVNKALLVAKAGCLTISLVNPMQFVIRKFRLSYDLSDMPPSHCVFIRQSCRSNERNRLLYAIQLRFRTSSTGKLALFREIRVVFAWSRDDEDPQASITTISSDQPPVDNTNCSTDRLQGSYSMYTQEENDCDNDVDVEDDAEQYDRQDSGADMTRFDICL